MPKVCHICTKTGHVARDCTEKSVYSSREQKSYSSAVTNKTNIIMDTTENDNSIH